MRQGAGSREPEAGSRRAAPRVCSPVSRLPSPVSRFSRGFTLLEVLLAVTLLALLLAGAYSGIQTAVKAMHSGELVIERLDRVRTVQSFLRRQLGLIMPLPYEQTPEGNYVFEGDRSLMRFVAPMPGYLSHGGPYVQTLALTRGRDGLRLVFSGAMLNGFDPKEEKAAERDPVVLLDHIRDGGFAYRALDEQGELGPWTDAWDDTNVTPLMIRIQLVMRSGERVDWPTLDVPMMLDAGAARIRVVPPALVPNPQGGGVVR
jgi:general secretion pathway protein J